MLRFGAHPGLDICASYAPHGTDHPMERYIKNENYSSAGSLVNAAPIRHSSLTTNKFTRRPFCTIHHWDLPQALEDRGGWPNRGLADYFSDCASILDKRFGDR